MNNGDENEVGLEGKYNKLRAVLGLPPLPKFGVRKGKKFGPVIKRKPNGGVTILTPEIRRKVCRLVRKGAYLETAAAFVGIHPVTLRTWLKRGSDVLALEKDEIPKEERKYVRFHRIVEKALAKAEMNDLEFLSEMSKKDIRALTFKMGRRWRKHWGEVKEDKETIVQTQVNNYVQVDSLGLPLETRMQILQAMRAKQDNPKLITDEPNFKIVECVKEDKKDDRNGEIEMEDENVRRLFR